MAQDPKGVYSSPIKEKGVLIYITPYVNCPNKNNSIHIEKWPCCSSNQSGPIVQLMSYNSCLTISHQNKRYYNLFKEYTK